MQRMLAHVGGCNVVLTLPPVYEHALPGIAWGRCDELFTPAFWRGQAWQHEALGTYKPGRLGCDLAEELAACMLGGYGIPAELGLAAFDRLRRDGLLVGSPQAAALEDALARPFVVNGRAQRYRFPKIKARSLAGALQALPDVDCDLPDRDFRDALVLLPGIGLKTASWIVRNWRLSDEVAILDIHIVRAGRIAGFLLTEWDPAKHYRAMEDAFLQFSEAIGVRPSVLDGVMWDYMRRIGSLGREAETLSKTYARSEVAHDGTPMAAVPHAIM